MRGKEIIMKMNVELSELFSKQITSEYYSAYLYMSMSAYCSKESFKGFAHWMQIQAQEELAHGTHLFEYMLERGDVPNLSEIVAPPKTFNNLLNVFEQSLAHEQSVTKSINKIASLALQLEDHAAYTFILWYVNEQVEEESSADEIIQKLKRIGSNLPALYALDAELATRKFVYPF